MPTPFDDLAAVPLPEQWPPDEALPHPCPSSYRLVEHGNGFRFDIAHATGTTTVFLLGEDVLNLARMLYETASGGLVLP